MRTIAVEDVAELLTALHAEGCWEKTVAGALATLHRAVRFALRNGGSWMTRWAARGAGGRTPPGVELERLELVPAEALVSSRSELLVVGSRGPAWVRVVR